MSETQTTAQKPIDEQPTDEQLKHWKAQFGELADSDGYISRGDLEVCFQKENKNPRECDINTLCESFETTDVDGDGKINEEEFIKIQLAASKMNFYTSDIKNELENALAAFDENDDGTIDKEELKKILVDYDDEALDDVIKYADKNSDGKLSIKELAEYLTQML